MNRPSETIYEYEHGAAPAYAVFPTIGYIDTPSIRCMYTLFEEEHWHVRVCENGAIVEYTNGNLQMTIDPDARRTRWGPRLFEIVEATMMEHLL